MAMYPAGRLDGLGFMPYRFAGNTNLWGTLHLHGGRFNQNTGEVWSKASAVPDGYSAGGAWVLPIVAGGMSSWQANPSLDGSANMLAAVTLDGTTSIALVGDGNLALVVSLSGNGDVTLVGAGGMALTISLAGNGTATIIGDGGLSMLVPLSGAGDLAFTGAADLRGQLSMNGEWTPYTELSPQSLATAVWSALAAQNNEAGSMGDLLNAAGGGGISGAVIDQIVDAVWQRAGSNGAQYGATLTSAEKWAKLSAALSA